MDNNRDRCAGKAGPSNSSRVTHRDRFADARRQQHRRDRKKTGRAYFGVECDDHAARAAVDAWSMPRERLVALLVELAAMKAILPDPERAHGYVKRDGSCWWVWPDGHLWHFSADGWSKYKSAGFTDCVVGGWWSELGFSEITCKVLTGRDRARRRRLMGLDEQ